MKKKDLERQAFDYFNTGFCCCEAVSKTIIDHFAENPAGYPVKVASGFCGGIGRTHEDVCGALTGGVIAAGYLFGRTEKNKELSEACRVISKFREMFLEEFGSSNCKVIMAKFGEQENLMKCKQLTARATGMLVEILTQR